jgi:hypothetical protein
MTKSSSGPVPQSLTELWQQMLGEASLCVPIGVTAPKPEPSSGQPDPTSDGPPQLVISELFVRSDPVARRNLDLFCVALVEREPDDVGDPGPTGQLRVLGPQQLRALRTLSPAGLSIADLPLGPAPLGLRSVSIALIKMERRARVNQIASSVDELGRVLDYHHDPVGSDAVARVVLARLGILTLTSGVSLSIAGTVDLTPDPAGTEAYHLLTAAGAGFVLPDVALSDGRASSVRANWLPKAVRNNDFVMLRFGGRRVQRAKARSIVDLRREHALAEIGADPAQVSQEESYASRVAQVRQDARAKEIVLAAATGDTVAAALAYRDALAVPGAERAFREGLASRITTLHDFWLVDAVLEAAQPEPEPGAAPAGDGWAVRAGLDGRLDQLLALGASNAETELVVTPLLLEVADDLLPEVDSRSDAGRFLYELIPDMRIRIEENTGVTVPGLRARSNPNLALGNFQVQIDEVPVLTGLTGSDARYQVRAHGDGHESADEQQTPIHPLTGQSGLWLVRRVDGEPARQDSPASADDDGEEAIVTAQHYLIHQIEMVLRSRLDRFLGPEELHTLIAKWSAQDAENLITATLPDARARLRLTWVIQALLADRVPITDWRTILRVIREAGGMTAPLTGLRRAVRAGLRAQLPGPHIADREFRIPAAYEASLLEHPEPAMAATANRLYLELLAWLHDLVATSGPVLSVVTRSQEAREHLAALVRTVHPFITTLTEDELST